MKSENLRGWETLLNKNRSVKAGGEKFDSLIPKPTGKRVKIDEDMNPFNTVPEMFKIVKETAYQTQKLATHLANSGSPVRNCEAIWQFIFDYILYKEEEEEELREPSHSWHIQRHLGCDCDDMAIFAASLLYNLNIPFQFRITKYRDALTGLKKDWQHVYVIVPIKTQVNGKNYLIIDPVLNKFNCEIPFAEKHDFNMGTYRLSGGFGVADNTKATNSSKSETQEMIEFVKAILDKTKADTSFAQSLGYHPANLIEMCEKALSVAHDEKRFEEAIEMLSNEETKLNDKNGIKLQGFGGLGGFLGDLDDDTDDDLSGDLGKLFDKIKTVANKVKDKIVKIATKPSQPKPNQRAVPKLLSKFQPKKLFQNIKTVIKEKVKTVVKAVKGKVQAVKAKVNDKIQAVKTKIKEVGLKNVLLHAVTKVPNAVGRAGFHLFLKLNLFGVAETLRWGLLSEQEAQSLGVPKARWEKSKAAYEKLKKFHYQMGGEDKVLRSVIEKHTGKRGLKGLGFAGVDLGALGVEPVTTTAAISAALPTIAGALKIIHDSGLINMFKKKPSGKGVKGLGEGSNDGEAQAGSETDTTTQSSADLESDTGKKNFIAQLWEWVKSVFAKKPAPDFANEEVVFTEETQRGNETNAMSTEDSGSGTGDGDGDGTGGGTGDGGSGSNTMLYVGLAAAAAVVIYVAATKDDGNQAPRTQNLGKIANSDQQTHFKKVKTETRFRLS